MVDSTFETHRQIANSKTELLNSVSVIKEMHNTLLEFKLHSGHDVLENLKKEGEIMSQLTSKFQVLSGSFDETDSVQTQKSTTFTTHVENVKNILKEFQPYDSDLEKISEEINNSEKGSSFLQFSQIFSKKVVKNQKTLGKISSKILQKLNKRSDDFTLLAGKSLKSAREILKNIRQRFTDILRRTGLQENELLYFDKSHKSEEDDVLVPAAYDHLSELGSMLEGLDSTYWEMIRKSNFKNYEGAIGLTLVKRAKGVMKSQFEEIGLISSEFKKIKSFVAENDQVFGEVLTSIKESGDHIADKIDKVTKVFLDFQQNVENLDLAAARNYEKWTTTTQQREFDLSFNIF